MRCKATTKAGTQCSYSSKEDSDFCGIHADRNNGRPPRFDTPRELEDAIDSYFETHPDHPTQTGLALHLGFESRQSLFDYKERQDFSYTIKRALSRIDNEHEKRLYEGKNTGSIFYLKNRGWSDKSEIEHSGELKLPTLTVEVVEPDESQ